MLAIALSRTYKDVSQKSSRRAPPNLTDNEIREMYKPLTKNRTGFGSYKDLLVHTLGQAEGERLFNMDKQQLEIEADRSHTTSRSGGSAELLRQQRSFVLPQQVIQPKNTALGAIGNKMLQSRKNYEEYMKRA